jgi:hypothetical protein
MVLILLDLLLQLVEGNLLVLNDQVNLQLLDTEADSDELRGTPHEAILLNSTHILLQLLHVRLIVPWLDVHGYYRLGSRLDLACLLLVVLGETLFSDACSFCIFLLVVTAEEIDLIVILFLGCWRLGRVDGEFGGFGSVGCILFAWVAWQRGKFRLEGGDVLVPAEGVWELLYGGLALDGLEGFNVGLGGCVAVERSVLAPRRVLSIVLADWMQESEVRESLGFGVIWRGLKPPLKHGPNCFHHREQKEGA